MTCVYARISLEIESRCSCPEQAWGPCGGQEPTEEKVGSSPWGTVWLWGLSGTCACVLAALRGAGPYSAPGLNLEGQNENQVSGVLPLLICAQCSEMGYRRNTAGGVLLPRWELQVTCCPVRGRGALS